MIPRHVFWLGFGALIALAAVPSPVYAQTEPPPAVAKPSAAYTQELAFARFIALIRGHLLTGDELVSQRQWDAALPHFNFPTEEIYGIIRDEVKTYKTPPFDGALKALSRTVRAQNAKQFPKARQQVEDALAAADAGLKAREPNWPKFTVEVAMAVLKAAPDEYDDAVAKGRIVRPIGYQTARGIILQAERMVEAVAGGLAGGNAAALSDIRAGFAELKQAFAAVNPPKQAVLDFQAVQRIVSRIELAAGKLI